MKFIFVHHAHRKKGIVPSQEDDITDLGKEDANIVAELLELLKEKGNQIKAIYTSPFKRCLKTAKIINKKIDVKIFEEKRFNEAGSVNGETWLEVQNRLRDGILDIVKKYQDDDTVVCVTSGVNVVAFISLAFKLKPDAQAPFIGIPSCSPLIFNITLENFV